MLRGELLQRPVVLRELLRSKLETFLSIVYVFQPLFESNQLFLVVFRRVLVKHHPQYQS